MAKRYSPKLILEACQDSFLGIPDDELAAKYRVNKSTISNWRKLEIWIEFEAELIAAHKQHIMANAMQQPQTADAQG